MVPFVGAHSQTVDFETLDKTGTYEIAPGAYTASAEAVSSYRQNIVVNVGPDGDGSAAFTTGKSVVWLLEAYGSFNSTENGGSIIWNGNLSADMTGSYNDFKPIHTTDGGSTLAINGNLSINAVNAGSTQNVSFDTFLVSVESHSSASFNGDMDLAVKTVNDTGNAIGSAVTIIRGESVQASLGASNADKIWIHDISTTAGGSAESYGIFGENTQDYNLSNVIDVKGAATIENITASSSSSDSYAAGVEIHAGTANFQGDLTIRGINADEAYALAAYNGGKININADGLHTVKIEGDLDVATADSVINLNLSGGDSYLKGGVSAAEGGLVNISISNGATWHLDKTADINGLEISGGSRLLFNAVNETVMGKIVLVSADSFEITEDTNIEVVLGEYYRMLEDECSILLIDTSGIVESTLSDLGYLTGNFVWNDSGETAEGWSLKYVSGKGLYATNGYGVPEPAACAFIFGAFAFGLAYWRKRNIAKKPS